MAVAKQTRMEIRSHEDVVLVRQAVRTWAVECGFTLIDQTKLVTAASELARNTFVHGHGGWVLIELLKEETRRGVRLEFEDEGPGIMNIDQALKDGFTTGTGLGLGLGGAKRLSSEFRIDSTPGKGTRVEVIRWKT